MTERTRHPWRTKEMRELFDAILSLESRPEAEAFFRDLCTISELEAMAHRWQVARLLEQGLPYLDLAERGAEVRELLPLGFGSCRLEAAVPEEASFRTLDDLAGASVATVYPRLARELLTVDVSLVDVTGSVEIAPRLGLADAIVDLVSS